MFNVVNCGLSDGFSRIAGVRFSLTPPLWYAPGGLIITHLSLWYALGGLIITINAL